MANPSAANKRTTRKIARQSAQGKKPSHEAKQGRGKAGYIALAFGLIIIVSSLYGIISQARRSRDDVMRPGRWSMAGLAIPPEIIQQMNEAEEAGDRQAVLSGWMDDNGISFSYGDDGSVSAVRDGQSWPYLPPNAERAEQIRAEREYAAQQEAERLREEAEEAEAITYEDLEPDYLDAEGQE